MKRKVYNHCFLWIFSQRIAKFNFPSMLPRCCQPFEVISFDLLSNRSPASWSAFQGWTACDWRHARLELHPIICKLTLELSDIILWLTSLSRQSLFPWTNVMKNFWSSIFILNNNSNNNNINTISAPLKGITAHGKYFNMSCYCRLSCLMSNSSKLCLIRDNR